MKKNIMIGTVVVGGGILGYVAGKRRESIQHWKRKDAYRDGRSHALMLASVASMIDLFNADNIDILDSLDYKVDVAANFDFGSITSQERVDEYRQDLIKRGIGVFNIPIPRDLLMIKEMVISYCRIKKLVDGKNYSIVHCHSPIGGVLCRLACRKARHHGTKIIYTVHGFHFYKGAGHKAWLLYYPIEKFCSRFTDLIITINREDYKAAKKFHTCEVAYIPGIGIHTDEISNMNVDREKLRDEFGYTNSDFVFMSTGQISVRKNHEVVIRALSMLTGEVKERIKYLIVGFGEEEEHLKDLVKELDLETVVTFAGYRSDVKELLHIVDAFVFPSIQEGLPVALLEAMATGLPVVCSRIRGNVDLIEDGEGGYLVDWSSPEAFSRAMRQIAEGNNSALSMINKKRSKEFDSCRVNAMMNKLYQRMRF